MWFFVKLIFVDGGIGFTRLEPVLPYPALLFYSLERTLIVGDLHIGWEASLAEQGIHIPSQTPKFLEQFKKIIDNTDPTRIIILGDVKHDVSKVGLTEWRDIPILFETLSRLVREILIIPGNHDGNLQALLPRDIRMLPTSGITIDNEVGVLHGHAWPAPSILGCKSIVMGHLHPSIILRDVLGISTAYQVWLRTSTNGEVLAKALLKHLGIKIEDNATSTMKKHFNVTLTNPRCIFVPSFNSLLTGRLINKRLQDARLRTPYFGPLLRSGGVQVEDGDVYLIDGTYLGKLSQLQGFY